jgi:vacuolar iron transporter family protein
VTPETQQREWLENLSEERDGVALYEGLATIEEDPAKARSFRELAEGERRHAGIWERKLTAAGVALPTWTPSARVRMLLWLARRFGIRAILGYVLEAETAGADRYAAQAGVAQTLAGEEKEHREVLERMRELPGAALLPPAKARQGIARREGWHRGGRAGGVRAAIFGMNDGIVSNLALVLGVAAAGVPEGTVIVTGLAGLLAGAFSMATGEYVSVASQRDLLRRQVALEERELRDAPEEEREELAALLRGKGLDAAQADSAATEIMKNPEAALDTLVREELGLDPDDLGAPVTAAAASFVTFAAGAALPLAPFLAAHGTTAAVASAVLCATVLAAVGAVIGVLSGTGPLRAGLRMVLLAAIAAGATVGLGAVAGASLG